eukprot:scaffold207_cov409-Prasinococcus_capsulatus_cf.AAC.36
MSAWARDRHSYRCREGSCDCDKVFDDHDGHFPAICNVRNLLRELEPYQEEHARQQITVAFSLFDKPWFTTTNESIYDSSGMIAVESELPAQYVYSYLWELSRLALVLRRVCKTSMPRLDVVWPQDGAEQLVWKDFL